MGSQMKIALGQIDMAWEDKEASIKKVEHMLEVAAADRADLLILPEMSLTGFSMNLTRIGEDPQDSFTVKKMSTLARRYHVGIGVGWSAVSSGETQGKNCFTLIGDRGEVLGQYEKIHPFSYGGEARYYRGGDRLVIVPYKGRMLSLFVCYDLRFPELFQVASRQADIMLVIANWPSTRREQWISLLRARAVESQAYVVGVNCVGTRDGLEYVGDSMALDPVGNTLGLLSRQEGVLLCELEDQAWQLRDKFSIRQDRREDLYTRYYYQEKQD